MGKKENQTSNRLPSILDRELTKRSQDAFGHTHYANALRDLVESEAHEPPYSIGLLGNWGTGKSSIKGLYLDELANDPRRQDTIRTVTFNAWRYGGDSIKRALLRHVFLELGGDEAELKRRLYHQVSEAGSSRRSWADWTKEAILQNFGSVLVFAVLLIIVLGLTFAAVQLFEITGVGSVTSLVAIGLVISSVLSKFVVDLRLRAPSFFNPVTTISFPLTSAEEYESLLKEQMDEFGSSKSGRRCRRLVIFVDDLDRLSSSEMVAGLDAIRTFLELVSDNAPGFGVVFVISCDEDRVAEALAKGRGRLGNSELPGSVFSRSDARRYLDRLFQFRLEIPPFPKLDMRQFAEDKLRSAGATVAQVEASGARLNDVVDRLIHVDVRSPRNAIQLVNAFVQAWWIASMRENDSRGSTSPGGLQEGAVTKNPIALAALCVFQVDFPDFYEVLQRRPELRRELTAAAIDGQDPNAMAQAAQDELANFLLQGKEGSLTTTVRQDFRGLRRYLASIQGLRWPRSIQPLLLLSQDAVTRQYGSDRAMDVFEAFVSGDTQGVLEALGLHLGNDPLTTNDVTLLQDLAEGLNGETQTRRTNAARVLAALIDRIPAVDRRRLMTPLAREMISQKEVRQNVGPKAAKVIADDLASEDRRLVASAFASDLLAAGALDWRLPNGQTPNLKGLIADVEACVEFVLPVRETDALTRDADDIVLNWLLNREVTLGKSSQTLPFAQLNKWVSAHSTNLLEAIGAGYSEQAIEEFTAEVPDFEADKATIERISSVHRGLVQSGQEDRTVYWQQVTQMVSAKQELVALSASAGAVANASLATVEQARAFLRGFSARLDKDMQDQDNWALNWEQGAKDILKWLTEWSPNLDSETFVSISPLLVSWGGTTDTAEFLPRALRLMSERFPDEWNEVLGALIDQQVKSLPNVTLHYVAEHRSELNAQNVKNITAQLNAIVNDDGSDAELTKAYRTFVGAVPNADWASADLQSHLSTLLQRVETQFAQAPYVREFFPAARDLLHFAPEGRGAKFLATVFQNAEGALPSYQVMHEFMIGAWPEDTDHIGEYPALAIAKAAANIAITKPKVSRSVFISALQLRALSQADTELDAELSHAAAAVWPFHSQAVLDNVEVVRDFLIPADLKKILVGDHSDDPELQSLRGLVKVLGEASTQQFGAQTAQAIIADAPSPVAGEPDGGLKIWLNSLAPSEAGVLASLLASNDLNDSQLERLIVIAIDHRTNLGLDFFVQAWPQTMQKLDIPISRERLISTLGQVEALATDSDSQSRLCASLITAAPALTGNQLSRLAVAVKSLGGKASMGRQFETENILTVAQMNTLIDAFGGSRPLERARDRKAREE